MNIPSLLYIVMVLSLNLIEGCKWLVTDEEEISLIPLFDFTACTQAKQLSHEDSNHFAQVQMDCCL
jgi:hypothetical protein